jgi:CRISPR-associated endonuclease Csn1
MSYTLGLDIGAASIGWAMMNDSEILCLGTRVFPEGVERSEKGKESSKNKTRREKRLLRRQIARKAMRRKAVLQAFQTLGWLPSDPAELENIWHQDPYALRKKALDEPLTKGELARIFFHLSKRRGFKSNRKTDTDEELVVEETPETEGKSKKSKNKLREGKGEQRGYGEVEQLLRSGKVRTLGEYLASLNPHEVRIRARYALRRHYEDEFDKICDKQSAFHPELNAPVPDALLTTLCSRKQQEAWKKKSDQSLRAFIKSYLIFFQRPLKSQKHLVGKCSLEPNARRAPISSLAFQTYRIWDKLATIKLFTPEHRFLTPEEKARAAEILEKTEEITIGKLLEKIGLPKSTICNYDPEEKIKGNETAVQMMTMFKETDDEPTEKEQATIEAKWDALSEEEKERRWKIIYDATDNDWLEQYGKEKWGLLTQAQKP